MIPSPVQVDALRAGVYLRSDGQKKAARERAASSQRFARCEERCAASAVRMRQGIAVMHEMERMSDCKRGANRNLLNA